MSLSTRLDKLEAAMRGRDGGDPPDQPWLAYRLQDWAEGCPVACLVAVFSHFFRDIGD